MTKDSKSPAERAAERIALRMRALGVILTGEAAAIIAEEYAPLVEALRMLQDCIAAERTRDTGVWCSGGPGERLKSAVATARLALAAEGGKP